MRDAEQGRRSRIGQCKATLAEDENQCQTLTNSRPISMLHYLKKKQQKKHPSDGGGIAISWLLNESSILLSKRK
jgi:hypothetical protein